MSGEVVRVRVVRSRVKPGGRTRYLAAWSEWSGTLFTMGIRTELLEDEERPGEFLELTWFREGESAALGDQRLVRLDAELEAAAEAREGSLRLYGRRSEERRDP